MSTSLRSNCILIALCFLQALTQVTAHNDAALGDASEMAMSDGHAVMGGCGNARPMVMKDMEDFPDHPSYFLHDEHSGTLLAHIGIMFLAWTIVLPLAVMLSIGQSRYTMLSQIIFLILNAIGVLISVIYDSETPDLYENNSHHKLGWAVTWIALVWALLGLVTLYTRRTEKDPCEPLLLAVTQHALAERERLHRSTDADRLRWSQDSGQSTDGNPATLCASSRSNSWHSESPTSPPPKLEREGDCSLAQEKMSFLRDTLLDRFLSRHMDRLVSSRGSRMVKATYILLERSMIPLSFLALLTGIVTYSGIGRGNHIFNVIAHLIKGGIFFGYGLLTFGRWMGCFGDLGWAWNLKPGSEIVGRTRARMPSAEFVESFVICLYGFTNVGLEHIGAWGKAWTAMDFEHVSITLLFAAGGLLGMLIESHRVRALVGGALNHSSHPEYSEFRQPTSYVHSLNPMPSLVILLLGIMMSNHTQHSFVAGQIHKQWGLSFAGFAMARLLTYVTFWIKPPQTYLPTRPPTEIIASFCLISGGAMFMASNKDTINALEDYHLDIMFVFTVTMGFTCLIMAWTVVTIAVKGLATRRQYKRSSASGHIALRSPT